MIKQKNGNLIVTICAVFLFGYNTIVLGTDTNEDNTLVITQDAGYIKLNSKSFDILARGNLLLENSNNPIIKDVGQEIFVTKVSWSQVAHSILVDIVKPQTELPFMGSMFDDRTLRLKGTFEPYALLVDDYLLIPSSPKDVTSESAGFSVLDATTMKLIKNVKEGRFGPISCLVEGKDIIYSVSTLRKITTWQVVREAKFAEPALQVDCKQGKVLFLADENKSANPENLKAFLTLYDPSKNLVLGKVHTGMPMFGFSGDEWFLSPAADLVVRDEVRQDISQGGTRMNAKTGILYFFNIKTGEKLGELKLPIAHPNTLQDGFLGFSSKGKYLFYRSSVKMFVVDVNDRKLVKEIKFASPPIGVVWRD